MKNYLLILAIIAIASCDKQSGGPVNPQQSGGFGDTILLFDPAFPMVGNWVLKYSFANNAIMHYPQDTAVTQIQPNGTPPITWYSWASHVLLFNNNRAIFTPWGVDAMVEWMFSGEYLYYSGETIRLPFSVNESQTQTTTVYWVQSLTSDTLKLNDMEDYSVTYVYARKK